MFERYTEKARRAIFFARYEASMTGGHYIETDHLLLGLLREDQDLHALFRDLEAVREELHTGPAQEKVSTSVDMPLSHSCKVVLAYGAEEAEKLGHKFITPMHMLAGLLRTPTDDPAHAALARHGITLEAVRSRLVDGSASELPVSMTRHADAFTAILPDRRDAAREIFTALAAGSEIEITMKVAGQERRYRFP